MKNETSNYSSDYWSFGALNKLNLSRLFCFGISNSVSSGKIVKHKTVYKRAFSLMWLATIQIYWNKKKEFTEEKSSTPN